MKKNDIVNAISELLTPLGFKKSGSNWIFSNEEISKIVNLQKSKFGNQFYINYGFIIKSIPLENLKMHLFYGFGSDDDVENTLIKELLDEEDDVSSDERKGQLRELLSKKVINRINVVNTEDDVLIFLKRLSPPLSNMIPVKVKTHFGL